MRLLPLAWAALLLALPPLAAAGSPERPEVKDDADDADAGGVLDITAAWVDGADPRNVTFHVLVPKLQAAATATGSCATSGCVALALSFKLEFTVLAPDGSPAPTAPGYNRTYAVYRHGAPEALRTAVGFIDDAGTLNLTGTGSASFAAGEIILRLPRNGTAINLPAGPAPGPYRLANLLAHSSPQVCSPPPAAEPPLLGYPLPTPCASLEKPSPGGAATSRWDTAPDTGFGSDYVYPTPPQPAASDPPAAQGPSNSPGDPPAAPAGEPAPASSVSATASAPPGSTTTSVELLAPSTSKGTPGPGLPLALAAAAAAVALRRPTRAR